MVKQELKPTHEHRNRPYVNVVRVVAFGVLMLASFVAVGVVSRKLVDGGVYADETGTSGAIPLDEAVISISSLASSFLLTILFTVFLIIYTRHRIR